MGLFIYFVVNTVVQKQKKKKVEVNVQAESGVKAVNFVCSAKPAGCSTVHTKPVCPGAL